ncbi:MAG: class I adenylate-forming enzyme family protein [Ilumatobacteraceae bacterium]
MLDHSEAESVAHWTATAEIDLPRTTVGQLLGCAATTVPDRIALIDACGEVDDAQVRRRWTYAELLRSSRGIAAELLHRFSPGERIAIWAPNSAAWLQVNLGACLAGLVVVPMNPLFQRAEAAHVVRSARPAGIVHGTMHRDLDIASMARSLAGEFDFVRCTIDIEAAIGWDDSIDDFDLPDVTPDDPVQIQFTSGTTGPPKGVRLHHLGLTGMPAIAVQLMELEPAPVWLNVMPLYHIGGCGLSTMGPMAALGTQVLADRFSAAATLRLIEAERVTVMGSVPTMLIAMLEHPERASRDLTSLEVVMSGGATVSPDLVRTIERTLDVRFVVAFGQTECHGHITQTRPDDTDVDKAETVGRPIPGVEVLIADPMTGAALGFDEPGEVLTRSELIMHGYLDDPASTAAAIRPDGYLRTGDLCTMDRRGYLRVVGRVKDIIVRGGENISPREIEDRISSHPSVAEVAVVGVPDERLGEAIAAFVRAAPGAVLDLEDVARWTGAELSRFKVPVHWREVDALPLTPNGKVCKPDLKAAWASEHQAPS